MALDPTTIARGIREILEAKKPLYYTPSERWADINELIATALREMRDSAIAEERQRSIAYGEACEKKGFDNAEFWKDIILDDEKTPTQHIKDELHDYKIMLENVPIVYDNVTGGLLSKPLHDAEVVVDAFNDYLSRERDEAFDEGFASARERAAGIAENSKAIEGGYDASADYIAERIRAMQPDGEK